MGSYGGVLVTGPLVGELPEVELPDLPGLDPDELDRLTREQTAAAAALAGLTAELDPWPPVDP